MASTDSLQRRARLLLTLLAYVHTRFPPERAPALVGMLRGWLDTWSGVGRIIEAMATYSSRAYGERDWRATFYLAGREHSPTHAAGSAWQRTPWRAGGRGDRLTFLSYSA